MKPIIKKISQLNLAGFSFFGDPFKMSGDWSEENEIGRSWKRFMQYCAANQDKLGFLKSEQVMYEMHILHAESKTTGEYEIFVGVEVEQIGAMPVELSLKLIPAATYAVFTFRGQEIISDWAREIFSVWMPGSGYESGGDYSFERYDERFKGLDRLEESVLDVYIPVKRSGGEDAIS